jgi:syntaxin 16
MSSKGNNLFQPSALDAAMPNRFDMGFTEQQLTTIHTNEEAIDRRSKEINDIAKNITQMAELFRDLQTMIVDQGTLLDRIDYNIENMNTSVKAAHEELIQVFLSF